MFRGLILALVLVASSVHAEGKRHDARASESPQQANQNPPAEIKPSDLFAIKDQIKSVATALEAANNKKQSDEEKDEARRNLAAQEKIAFWTAFMFWVGLGEIAVTVVGVIFVYWTLTETRRIGEAQVRAYLG